MADWIVTAFDGAHRDEYPADSAPEAASTAMRELLTTYKTTYEIGSEWVAFDVFQEGDETDEQICVRQDESGNLTVLERGDDGWEEALDEARES